MRYIILILCTMLAPSACLADTDWYRVAANTTVVADWLQTREIARNDNYYETNKWLGENPSQSEVNRYFVAILVSYNILGELLPKPYGDVVYAYATLEHGKAVIGNYNIGVRIRF